MARDRRDHRERALGEALTDKAERARRDPVEAKIIPARDLLAARDLDDGLPTARARGQAHDDPALFDLLGLEGHARHRQRRLLVKPRAKDRELSALIVRE